jgi:sugar lactone lactonase YvrE
MGPEAGVSDWEIVVEVQGGVGEGPSWVADERALLWVATPSLVHRFDESTGINETFDVKRMVSAVVPWARERYLLAQFDGFTRLDRVSGDLSVVAKVEGMPAGTRFNDGKCDPLGRMWCGTVEESAVTAAAGQEFETGAGGEVDTAAHPEGAGSLYRLAPDGSVQRMAGGIRISNGMGWSPDFRRMYYIDSAASGVDVFDFDLEAGSISNRRRLISAPASEGLADGMAVDAQGYLWVAFFYGGAVRRFAPDGIFDSELSLPVTQVTSCCFGGNDLEDLYVTTGGLPNDEGEVDAHGGSLFRARPGVSGLPTWPFGG